jgi:signal transduction histidine kinase
MRVSLRTKLAASHTLVVVALMPILSLFLLYSTERVFINSLLNQLHNQAYLLRAACERGPIPVLIDYPQVARACVSTVGPLTNARVVILSTDRVVLATNRPRNADLTVGNVDDDPILLEALKGIEVDGLGSSFSSDIGYVVLPLHDERGIRGIMRVSYELDDWRAERNLLRWLILGSVALMIAVGAGLGLALAGSMIQPLQHLGHSARQIAAGNFEMRVRVASRDEIGVLGDSFNQMAAQLQDAQQSRERQLAAIVHEVARPLAGIRAAVETLRDGADADLTMRGLLLGGLDEEMARLQRLIGTLQGVLKRTLHPMQLVCATLSLEPIIRASATSFEPAAIQAGISLAVDVPPDLPQVFADQDRLIQVLTNLLDNAIKFTPAGGLVQLRAGTDPDAKSVWVSVSDTGTGIAPDELPHVFRQFYTGSAERPYEKRGMGLGLAICREILQAHHGWIEVTSQPGQGACFTFHLPISTH